MGPLLFALPPRDATKLKVVLLSSDLREETDRKGRELRYPHFNREALLLRCRVRSNGILFSVVYGLQRATSHPFRFI